MLKNYLIILKMKKIFLEIVTIPAFYLINSLDIKL